VGLHFSAEGCNKALALLRKSNRAGGVGGVAARLKHIRDLILDALDGGIKPGELLFALRLELG